MIESDATTFHKDIYTYLEVIGLLWKKMLEIEVPDQPNIGFLLIINISYKVST